MFIVLCVLCSFIIMLMSKMVKMQKDIATFSPSTRSVQSKVYTHSLNIHTHRAIDRKWSDAHALLEND